ncbi:hypothetical protein GDO86_004605 [Hymenochirus boettgeri]|uniref:Uncharacterized protein n=1 Tax=Hymenochirus boettgeri TaxID=247094 RepID=A0A8T2KE35_9PIPI|nr:hypothetical protein GDO86_004605 [Hymenochirus boettgeri]
MCSEDCSQVTCCKVGINESERCLFFYSPVVRGATLLIVRHIYFSCHKYCFPSLHLKERWTFVLAQLYNSLKLTKIFLYVVCRRINLLVRLCYFL